MIHNPIPRRIFENTPNKLAIFGRDTHRKLFYLDLLKGGKRTEVFFFPDGTKASFNLPNIHGDVATVFYINKGNEGKALDFIEDLKKIHQTRRLLFVFMESYAHALEANKENMRKSTTDYLEFSDNSASSNYNFAKLVVEHYGLHFTPRFDGISHLAGFDSKDIISAAKHLSLFQERISRNKLASYLPHRPITAPSMCNRLFISADSATNGANICKNETKSFWQQVFNTLTLRLNIIIYMRFLEGFLQRELPDLELTEDNVGRLIDRLPESADVAIYTVHKKQTRFCIEYLHDESVDKLCRNLSKASKYFEKDPIKAVVVLEE